jgi:hypothetical protein
MQNRWLEDYWQPVERQKPREASSNEAHKLCSEQEDENRDKGNVNQETSLVTSQETIVTPQEASLPQSDNYTTIKEKKTDKSQGPPEKMIHRY